jgi:transcriptional antiterminator RfaH
MSEPFWACVRTQPQREVWAGENLEARGVEIFLPKIETRKTVQPLFASYIFALVVEGRWLAINTCFGVLSVIRFGDVPARVPDREIEALRARADDNGIIRLPPAPPARVFKRGDRVRILAGQFASFDAIHSGMSNRAREIVLVNMLGATRQVPVARHLVAMR